MGLVIVTEPATEPITTAEAKTHLRVDSSTEDAYVDTLITTARKSIEAFTSRALITQTWDLWWDLLPSLRAITIPKPPLQSVTHFKYHDEADVESVFGSINYFVDTTNHQGGRVSLVSNSVWPTATLRYANAFVCRFVAGYGSASSVPMDIRHACKLLVAHWFENREPVNVGSISTDLPLMVQHILWPYRVLRL